MSTTVSAKIPEELKRELEAEDVNISETIREALEAEIRRRRRAALLERADDVRSSIDATFCTEELGDSVREDRRKH